MKSSPFDLALDSRRMTLGLNGQAWAWGFLCVVLSLIVDCDEAIEIVRAVQCAEGTRL